MSTILMALLWVALFSLMAWAVVTLVPAPNPTVAMIKNVLVGVCALIFIWWLLGYVGMLSGSHALGHPVR